MSTNYKIKKEVVYIQEDRVSFILESVASACGVTVESLKVRGNKRDVVDAKHLCRYFIYTYTILTLSSTIRQTGGVNHTTVISSINKVDDFLKTDKSFRQRFKEIESVISAKFDFIKKIRYE